MIDPGMAWAMSHVTAVDTGARLENVVYLHLRREHGRLLQGEIAYYLTASGREVDFVVHLAEALPHKRIRPGKPLPE